MSPDPVRDEAERLVAAAIAAVSVAARGLSGGAGRPSFATGTPECCICPLCRVIAAMREPSPELSERLATGAGDLAAAVTSLLRAFARPDAHAEPDEGDEYWESLRRQARPSTGEDHDPWHAATTAYASPDHAGAPSHAAPTPPKPSPPKPSPPKPSPPKPTPPEPTPPEPTPPEPTPPKPMAKKAVAKKAVAKKAVKETAAEQGDQ